MIAGDTPVVPLYDHPVNIMIDLETTGTKPGCGILTIGAVAFLVGDGKQHKFYMQVLPESNEWYGLVEDPKTMDWWKGQPEEVRKEAFSGEDYLEVVLDMLTRWIESLTAEPIVWGNSVAFDPKILEAAYQAALTEGAPWKYYNEMCFRTLKSLFAGSVLYEPVPGKIPHHALWDAIDQAAHAEKCYIAMSNTMFAAQQWIDSQAAQKAPPKEQLQ